MLNHLFGSTESMAKEIELDEGDIIRNWKKYFKTISKKKEIIERLRVDRNFQSDLQELKDLLELELINLSNEEKEESELVADLETITHSQKIKRVQKLEQCLGYAETKYEHVYELLRQLSSFLQNQLHLVTALQEKSKDIKPLLFHLKLQLELELKVLKQIEEIKTFHHLFLALVKGEHIIRSMDSREKRLLKKMQKGISKIFSNEINKGITFEWTMTVFNAIEDKDHEGVANGVFDGYHPDIDFEFVNRSEFVALAVETIQILRKRKVSEQMITAFVHLFREWYNHERG